MVRKTLLALFTTVQLFAATVTLPQHPNRVEEWKRWGQQYDKKKIRLTGKMHTDTSTDFLAVPADYNELRDFEIAATPPTVDFGIIQGYKPWYLPVLYRDDYRTGGMWEGYGDVTRGPDGCFYFSIGDHRSYNGNAYIVRYNPKTKTHRLVVDLLKTMKWTPKD